MSATAAPPPAVPAVPAGPPRVAGAAPRGPAPADRPRARAADARVGVRLCAAFALAAFAAQAWADTLRPEANGRLLGAAAAGFGVAVLALLCSRLRRPLRGVALAAVAVLGGVLALLLAGVPLDQLRPRNWDDLAGDLGGGIAALPGLSVPYRGVDAWNRTALLLCGTALTIAGLLVAAWPGRSGRPAGPYAAAVILSTCFAVPAVQLTAERPFLDGAIFAVLLAGVLFAERLRAREVAVAAPVLVTAAIAGALVSPALDADEPWIDYEGIAQSLGERGTTAFNWNHGYGPLDWPRDGREVLRIRSPVGEYWKATTLADFDGVRWRETRRPTPDDDPAAAAPNPRWVHELRVSVRNLRTTNFVTAGTTLRIERSPRTVVPGTSGSYVTGGDRPLRRGHAYLSRVYSPKPRPGQLDAAGADFPSSMWPYLSMRLPEAVGGPAALDPATGLPSPTGVAGYVVFPPWGDPREPLGYRGRGYGERAGAQWLRASDYARTYRLARRLRARATTPYDFVRRVQAHLSQGYSYTETPPAARVPLESFLFDDRVGYCQQFSGAMTLLLRMGGVPARVASGFTPGTRDTERREYIVRDVDAHSWVEAYFPGYGWMTFDPTPAVAPARSQTTGIVEETQDEADDDEQVAPRPERGGDPAALDGGPAAEDAGGPPVVLLALGGLLVAGAVAVGVLVVLGRRRRARMGPDEWVAELERALRRSGRLPARGLTLQRLEHRLRAAPQAAAYVRAVRAWRYGFGGGSPTPEQRRALRRELGAGLGLRGRLRSLWALPPW